MELNGKKILYLCGSRYSLMNCINMAYYYQKEAEIQDIVVFDTSGDLYKAAIHLNELNIFRNVACYSNINFLPSKEKIKLFLFPKRYLKKCLLACRQIDYNAQYDCLISQALFYAALIQRLFGSVDTFLIEEGLSSYTSRGDNSLRRNRFFKVVNTVLLKQKEIKIQGIWLYKPKMYVGNISNVIQLPTIDYNLAKTLDYIFEYKMNDLYNGKNVVYLGNPNNGLQTLLDNTKVSFKKFDLEVNSIIKQVLDLGENKIIYRKHPKQSNEEIDSFILERVIFDHIDNMWELEAFNSISDNDVIISFFSSAAFTPKIVFDMEPVVILLNNLLDEELYNANRIISELKDIYNNKDKVISPKTIDELKIVLKRYT